MRSSWKLPFTSRRFNRLSLYNDRFDGVLHDEDFFLRRFLIPRTLEGKGVSIYNGTDEIDLKIFRGEVGHRFGEFSITKILGAEYRLSFGWGKKKKKNKRRKK
jgi:ribosomal protein S19